jgi:site-specific DNA-methyltransferase (adenine-specific)
MIHQVLNGDCLDVLRGMADNSVDSIVTDPPYGLAFMGKRWDYDVPSEAIWAECLRVLKPGGHLLAFAGTRTQHRMAVRIEDAGFEIRDLIMWCHGQGFPKSHNLSGEWQGWGTALKPALEPITVARKPLTGTVAANVLEWSTGALNIDGCRVGDEMVMTRGGGGQSGVSLGWSGRDGRKEPTVRVAQNTKHVGRWPANLIHDGSEEATEGLGSAARFFYCAKASRSERDAGLDDSTAAMRNPHPTVKPVALMRWLCRLVTPPGGVVLDPFAGSGSTGVAAVAEGFSSILIERDTEYVEIIRRRLAHAQVALFAEADHG